MRVQEVTVDGSVAIEKRLSSRERDAPLALARLRAEADLLRRLDGRVTPRLIASGEDAAGPWFRAEKIPFPTLRDRLEKAGCALSPAYVERAARSAFTAMAELHDAHDDVGPLGVVHADLSPANIAIDDAAERTVFLDLELASWRAASEIDGSFRGTVLYCAPEVARGERPTGRSDLFALAATLLHAATGVAPRSGPSFAAVLAAAGEQPIISSAHDGLAARGPGHAAVIACLALAAEDRPSTARDVIARILC